MKKVVKTVAEEEYRTRNVIKFGLTEEKDENVSEQVQEIFAEIGLKLFLQASRAGKTGKVTSKHPVSLSSASTVYQIPSQVKRLHQSAKFKDVFVRPDRSEEERASDRLLVQELVKKRETEPWKLHYIRGGTIHTRDKPAA